MVKISLSTDELFSVAQAAEIFKKPRLTIYRWIKRGKINAIKLGGGTYIEKSEIERIKGGRE